MKASPRQKMKMGIFTVTGIALLVLGVFLIGSRKNMFGQKYTIYGTFRNVGGLQPGNAVRFNGISIGTVETIDITSDTTVVVGMSIQEKVRKYIKDDAVAGIGSDGLMGDKLITITPGVGGAVLADKGSIRTKDPMDIEKSIAKFNKVIDNATNITTAVADISNQITSGKGSIGRLIYSDNLERGLEKTIYAAQKTVTEAHSTFAAVHQTVNSAHETIDSAKLTLKAAQRGVEGFADNMEAAKHSILLRGFFKKKARAANRRVEDSLSLVKEQERKDKREERRAKRILRRNGHDAENLPQFTGLSQ